jgi:Ubiquitin interaction motif
VEYILSGEFERDKLNPAGNSSRARGLVQSVGQIFTRSKSPNKQRKPSPSTETLDMMNVSDDEDTQLRLALEMSMQTHSSSRERSPQPPSMAPSDEKSPYFGPARRSDYHEPSWGMVLAGSSQQETGVVKDQTVLWSSSERARTDGTRVSPRDRKRAAGMSTVLEGCSTGGWVDVAYYTIAGLMTILHKIPKAREAFLLAVPKEPDSQDTPGDTWWLGSHPLTNPETSNEIDVTGEILLRECGRTMAFLDDSERAYGRFTLL